MADEFPTVFVEAAFAGPTLGSTLILDDSIRGKLDTGTLGEAGTFTDITDYVHSIDIRRGSSRVDSPVLAYDAGSCSITLDNSDRRFDPTNLSGPYVSGGATQLLPMRALRVRATYDDGSTITGYDLFRGFVDSWQISYNGPNYSQCILTATDGMKVLANVDRVAGASVGGSENTGARVGRILTSASWPTLDRVISTGNSTLQATTLADNALSEINVAVDSELGHFYMDAAGRAVFKNRTHGWTTTSQATFSDASATYPYADIEIEYGDETIYNDVRINNTGGTVQSASDATSQSNYLIRSFERTDLILESDTDALNYARAILYLSKDAELRFSSITVNPRTAPATLFPQVLGRDFGDRVTAVRNPPGGGTITRECFIRGVEHVIKPLQWETKWTLQSATKFSFLVLDHTTNGVLDSNALGY